MFPHSPVINITQNVNIFVKTKNAQEGLELLKSYKWTGLDWMDGLDGWILLRSLVRLEHLRC